jgi:hypothetical protein
LLVHVLVRHDGFANTASPTAKNHGAHRDASVQAARDAAINEPFR